MSEDTVKGFVFGAAVVASLWIVYEAARSENFRDMTVIAKACIEQIKK